MTVECMMGALGSHLFRGWFYPHPSSMRAKDGFEGGGMGQGE